MHLSYLLLGSNLGNRAEYLANARNLIELFVGDIKRASAIYETLPWGVSEQPNFYNQAIAVATQLSAEELLLNLLQIEEKLGRERSQKWQARKIDLDILYYQQDIISQTQLTVPHPQIEHRRFTLVPLVEIAPDYVHPVLQQSNAQLLAKCQDTLEVKKITEI